MASAASVNTRRALETRLIEKAWKDPEFRKEVVRDPKGMLEKACRAETDRPAHNLHSRRGLEHVALLGSPSPGCHVGAVRRATGKGCRRGGDPALLCDCDSGFVDPVHKAF